MPDFDDRTTLGADGAHPSTIPTPEEIADAKAVIAGGEAALVIEGERVASLRRVGARYVMSGRGDRHPLRVDATDEARLVAHWRAFRWAVSNQVAAEALAWKALITSAQRREMLANGACRAAGEDVDPLPVVALFTPDAQATWLLSELDPEEPDFAFGLRDLGLGFPELGQVLLSEIAAVHGRLGLKVERSLRFRPCKPLSRYAADAQRTSRIQL